MPAVLVHFLPFSPALAFPACLRFPDSFAELAVERRKVPVAGAEFVESSRRNRQPCNEAAAR